MTAASSALPAPNLMPLMRYRDLAAAMSWLERAFGFEKQIAVTDSDGEVIYGQMTYRGSLMMMGAVRDTDLDKLMRQPDEVGDVETQSCYIVVDDADAHYAKALDAGAEIVLEIKSDGLGRRGYSCRDPQGHIWNFGTYNPGKGLATTVVAAPAEPPAAEAPPPPRRGSRAPAMALATLLLALGVGGWWFADEIKADLAHRLAAEQAAEAEAAYAELAKVRAEKRASDALAAEHASALETERAHRQAMEADVERAAQDLAQAQNARLAAEAEAVSLREELKRSQKALEAANEARRISEEKLAVNAAPAPEPPAPDTRPEPVKAEPPPAPTPPAKAPPGKSAAVEQAPPGAQEIETSATGPAPEAEPAAAAPAARAVKKAAADEDDDQVRRKPARSARETGRSAARAGQKKHATARPESLPPTYIVNLHDVPWPYSTWYK